MQAVFSSVWGVSSIAGPLVGGFITDAISWRWVFYLNLPIGLVAAVIVHRSVPEHASGGKISLDWQGGLLLFLSTTLLLVALTEASPIWARGRVDLHRRAGADRENGGQSDPAAGPLPKPHRDGGEHGGISLGHGALRRDRVHPAADPAHHRRIGDERGADPDADLPDVGAGLDRGGAPAAAHRRARGVGRRYGGDVPRLHWRCPGSPSGPPGRRSSPTWG